MSDSSQDTVTYEEIEERREEKREDVVDSDSDSDDLTSGLTLGAGGNERNFRCSTHRVFEIDDESDDGDGEEKSQDVEVMVTKVVNTTTKTSSSFVDLDSDQEEDDLGRSSKVVNTNVLPDTITMSSDEEDDIEDDIEDSKELRRMKEELRQAREGRIAVKCAIRQEDREFARERERKKRRLEIEGEIQKKKKKEEENAKRAALVEAAVAELQPKVMTLTVRFGDDDKHDFVIPENAPLQGLFDQVKKYKSWSTVIMDDPDGYRMSPDKLPEHYDLENDLQLSARTTT